MKNYHEKLGRMLGLLVVCVVSLSAAVHASRAAEAKSVIYEGAGQIVEVHVPAQFVPQMDELEIRHEVLEVQGFEDEADNVYRFSIHTGSEHAARTQVVDFTRASDGVPEFSIHATPGDLNKIKAMNSVEQSGGVMDRTLYPPPAGLQLAIQNARQSAASAQTSRPASASAASAQTARTQTASAASRTAASPVSLAAPVPDALSAYEFQLMQFGRGGAYEMRARQEGAESAHVQVSLGAYYEHGVNVAQDYAYAAYWYTMAAEYGNREAQRYLGSLYERGLGVDQDYAKAVYWYTKAGEQGEEDTWRHLAYMYENGADVSKDSAKAEYWYKKMEGEAAARTDAFAASDARRKQPGITYTQYGDAIVTDASGTTTYYMHGYTTSDGYDLVSNHYDTKSAIVVHPDGTRTYYDGFGYNMSAGDGINVRQGNMTSQEMREMTKLLDEMTPEEILGFWGGRDTGY